MVSEKKDSFFGIPVMAGMAGLLYNAIIHSVHTEGKWQYVLVFCLLFAAAVASNFLQGRLPESLRGIVLPLMIIGFGLAVGGYAHYALQKGLIPYLFVILGTGYFIFGGLKMIDRI
jgi:phosphatidylserine synthase